MSRRTQRNIGVIGLGIIGSRVAENLRQRGFHVFVWNRTPKPVPNFVGSPKEVAELCDIIQIFVSDDEALLSIVQRITSTLKAQHLIMAHSTVSPDTMRAAAEIVERKHAQFLDAPFTGSKAAAANGQLIYYVGGEEAALQRARPVLEASSKEIIAIGAVGQATTIKVATNMVTAATVQAAAEALALVHHAGLSADKFTAAMRNNGSNSPTLEMKLPMIVAGNFETNFSVKHMLKDVAIASRLGRAVGLEFGATDAARQSLLEEAEQGRGDADYSSLARAFFRRGGPIDSFLPGAANDEDQARLDLEVEETPPPPEAEAEPVLHRNGDSETAPTHANGAAAIEELETPRAEIAEPEIPAMPESAPVDIETPAPAAEVAEPEPEPEPEREPEPKAELEPEPEPESHSAEEEEIVVRSAMLASRRAQSSQAQQQAGDEEDEDTRGGIFRRFWRRGIDD